MKIGLVCPYNIIAGGGVQECVFALREELIAKGHQAVILSPRPRAYQDQPPEGVVFVGSAAKVKSFHTTSQISASAEADSIDDLLNSEQFDILHFHEPWVPFVSRQILTRSNTYNVATFHAKLPEGRVNRTIEKVITPYTSSILKYFDELTAVPDAAAEYVTSLTDQPISMIPNGIDLSKYQAKTKKKSTANNSSAKILFVGRLERRKGIVYLLDAFNLLQEQYDYPMTLDIAGEGPDEKRLKYYIEQQGIKNVTFHGFVSEDKKLKLLHDAAVFCSAAPYGESFGIVLLEAMAVGTPIVAADNPGYTSVLKERGSTSIVNPKNTRAFTERLHAFLTDDELRASWQKWADGYVQQFNYGDITRQYSELYERVCSKKQ